MHRKLNAVFSVLAQAPYIAELVQSLQYEETTLWACAEGQLCAEQPTLLGRQEGDDEALSHQSRPEDTQIAHFGGRMHEHHDV